MGVTFNYSQFQLTIWCNMRSVLMFVLLLGLLCDLKTLATEQAEVPEDTTALVDEGNYDNTVALRTFSRWTGLRNILKARASLLKHHKPSKSNVDEATK